MIRYLTCSHCACDHVAYSDCDLCRGHGHYLGGDEYHPCLSCRARYQEYVAALDAMDRELMRAKEGRA